MLGNRPYVLGNGLHGLRNGLQVLGIMSQFGIMLHSVLCRIRGYVVRHYVPFGVMLFGIMLHSALCRSAMCRLA